MQVIFVMLQQTQDNKLIEDQDGVQVVKVHQVVAETKNKVVKEDQLHKVVDKVVLL